MLRRCLRLAVCFAGRYLRQNNRSRHAPFFQRAADKDALASVNYHAARIAPPRTRP